jgi:hypothetical protein
MKPTIRHATPTPDPYRIRDNGRRGEPLPGCDCMRCFGMCLLDPDLARREIAIRTAEIGEGEE